MSPEETGGARIRRATTEDWPAIRRLVGAAGLPLDGLADSHAVFVAARGGHLLGTAAVERHGDGDTTAYLLRSVAVEGGERRSGIGSRLVERALSEVRPGRPVGLLTEAAADWFGRWGFVRVDRDQLPASLAASVELRGVCPTSARPMLLRGGEAAAGDRVVHRERRVRSSGTVAAREPGDAGAGPP
jgi:amino-acid N-acetyltransferase